VRFVWHPNRTHVFAINPLGIPFEVVAIEAEQAIQGAFSVGANFSYFSPSDYTRSSFEVKGRLYPNEEAPRAFAVGLGLGAVNTREHVTENGVESLVDETSPSIAVYVDYNWLLGRGRRFYVGSGLGAKRILGDADAFDSAPFVRHREVPDRRRVLANGAGDGAVTTARLVRYDIT